MLFQSSDTKGGRGASFFSYIAFLAVLVGLGWGGYVYYEKYYSEARKLREEALGDMSLIARTLQRHYRQQGKWPLSMSSLSEKELSEVNQHSPWGEEYFLIGNEVVCHENKNMANKLVFPFKSVSAWEYEYHPTLPLHEDPGGWTKIGAGFAEIQKGETLLLKDEEKGGSIKFRREFSPLVVDHDFGYTIEMEVRVFKGFSGDFFLCVNDGAKVYTISFFSDKVVFKAGAGMLVATKAADLSSHLCVLRLIVGDGDYFISLDGETLMIVPENKITYTTTDKFLTIGLDSRGNTKAAAELKSFCFTTNGPMY